MASSPTSSASTFSRFGGLWTDRSDAETEIARRLGAGSIDATDAARLERWISDGYVILEGAVDPELCDAFGAEVAALWSDGADDVLMQTPGDHNGRPIPAGTSPATNRVIDIFAVRPLARQLLFAPSIIRFLTIVFDDEPLLFQSLTFEAGSEQGIHQDTAYVVVSSPLELAASWIALEDVVPESGELQYYEGSHRLPEYLFSGAYKHWNSERDGPEQHDDWARRLHTESERMGLPLRTFRPKKGDVLIWSADLAHGGAPVVDRTTTRRSLVGHYCPGDIEPNYYSFRPDRRTAVKFGNGSMSSVYYDLAASADGPLPASGAAP